MNAEDMKLMYEALDDIRRIVMRNDPEQIQRMYPQAQPCSGDHSAESAERPVIVSFTCHLPDNQDDFWLFANASRMWSLLYALDQKCREVEKHEQNPPEGRVALADELRQMIRDEIDLYELS